MNHFQPISERTLSTLCIYCAMLCFLLVSCTPIQAFTENNSNTPETTLEQRAIALLHEKCGNCHGSEKREGDLSLVTRQDFIVGGSLGTTLNTMNIEQSLLLQVIRGDIEGLEMPPKNPLSATEIELIRRWLKEGALWHSEPNTHSSNARSSPNQPLGSAWEDPDNPVRKRWLGERLNLWSLHALTPSSLAFEQPTANDSNNDSTIDSLSDADHFDNPIDQLVNRRRLELGLPLPARADKATLLRRLYFDLTGLPPRFADTQDFVNSRDPNAYRNTIDRLLASPAYGEHFGRLWLDVIRYSDSNGFDWDEFRPQAWRFRNYVIDAWNEDMPYDQFVIEQLAGDELKQGDAHNPNDERRLIATGFLRLGPYDNAAPLFNEQDRSRAEFLSDITETTGSAFLGQTLACCRCHDHKTDPWLQTDYYRLKAFFAAVEFGNQPELVVREEPTKVPDTFVFYQGDHQSPRESVEPGIPAMFAPASMQVETTNHSTGRRLALAKWIASPENPWTARVIVNRIWQFHFGTGIVATPNDFGWSGETPESIELLDWLASELIRSQWSIKHIQRLILSSRTYQEKTLLTNWPRKLKRLSAEQLRDSMLAVSGLLQSRQVTSPIWPPIPEDVLTANPATLDDNETKTKGWYPSAATEQSVRSVYLIQKRTVRIPFMETFDLPDNSVSCGCRTVSIVAPQALSLLNGDWGLEAAEELAQKIKSHHPESPSEQIRLAYQTIFQREPSDMEQQSCVQFLQKRALSELTRALLNTNEFAFVE